MEQEGSFLQAQFQGKMEPCFWEQSFSCFNEQTWQVKQSRREVEKEDWPDPIVREPGKDKILLPIFPPPLQQNPCRISSTNHEEENRSFSFVDRAAERTEEQLNSQTIVGSRPKLPNNG